ncbi:hypothetical protein Fmac_012363 [Flemingia macrophylla]|uniref:Uncharacterized protein n=1 Tax=Flemingia macrophylla TaxID=520843 RepID=A0ABD1MQ28_9FABA
MSKFLDVVFDRLASPEVVNLIRGKKLELETTLRVQARNPRELGTDKTTWCPIPGGSHTADVKSMATSS